MKPEEQVNILVRALQRIVIIEMESLGIDPEKVCTMMGDTARDALANVGFSLTRLDDDSH